MTNAEIIMRESIDLMEQGILAGKLEKFTDENGEEVEMTLPEEIHTFDQWQKQGRIVKYGEHAIAKFPVWSPTKASQKVLEKTDKELTDKEKKQLKMYMRNACWFKLSQTQTLEEAEKDRKARQDAKKTEKSKPDKKTTTSSAPVQAKPEKTEKTAKKAKKSETKKTAKTKSKTSSDKELVTLRNAFEKATLKKNPSRYLLVERHGDDVYLCDTGWYIAKVSHKDYEEVFTKKSHLTFPPLSDGMGWRVDDKDSGSSIAKDVLKNVFDSQFGLKDKIKIPVNVLDYTTTAVGGDVLRAIKCDGSIKAVNDAFLKAFPKNTVWLSTADLVTPIVSKMGAILPVRVGDEFVKNAK